MRRRAFTLIELLIVIGIIGLIAVFAVVSLTRARARGRDTNRLAAMAQIQKALALGQNATNGNYPTNAAVTLGQPATEVLCLNGGNVVWQANSTGCTANNIYMGNVPADPLTGQAGFDYAYKYYANYNGTGPGYCISTTLEIGDSNLKLNPGSVMIDPTGTQNGTCP